MNPQPKQTMKNYTLTLQDDHTSLHIGEIDGVNECELTVNNQTYYVDKSEAILIIEHFQTQFKLQP